MPGSSPGTDANLLPQPSPATHTGSGLPTYRGPFSLVVHTRRGEIHTVVAPLSATIRPDGSAEPIDPPHGSARQWDTAAWIEQSAYPARTAGGPSYIYGHACHYHLCPFTRLSDSRIGDTITVQSSANLVKYRVCAIGLSAKDGNLVVPRCKSSGDLVLVTCQYESGDTSTNNLVVVASLIDRPEPTK